MDTSQVYTELGEDLSRSAHSYPSIVLSFTDDELGIFSRGDKLAARPFLRMLRK